MISVLLEIVVRLFFCPNRTFDWLVISLYNEIKKRLVLIMREKKNHLYVDSFAR